MEICVLQAPGPIGYEANSQSGSVDHDSIPRFDESPDAEWVGLDVVGDGETAGFGDICYLEAELPTVMSLEAIFELLADQWRKETEFVSSVTKMHMHPAYLRIIAMGPRIISPVLKELQARPDQWFAALEALSGGVNPIADEDAGNLRRMADAWLAWGRDRGYIS